VADQATAQEFDILVLGGGSGGYATALRAVQLGFTVGLVEKAKLGGTCLHNGCIPTKALLHSAEVADHARDGVKYGVNVELQSIDMNAVNAYKDGIIAGKYKGLQGLIKGKGITVIEGEGKLTAPDTITVNGTAYKGKNIVLATGSYSRSLPGLEIGGRVITSDEALTMDYVPKSVIVLGGGVIGVEFASVWKSFGVDVTIVEGLPSLVPNARLDHQGPGAHLQEARHQVQHRHLLPGRRAGQRRRQGHLGGRQDLRSGASARCCRTRTVHGGPRVRRSGRHR